MDRFEIGGRAFQAIGESTMRHDVFAMRQIAACGLNAVPQVAGETDEQFIYRLYKMALATGDIFLLLGALILPDGADPLQWTPELAAETGNFLASLHVPEDKAKLRILLASALMPFFNDGRRLQKTFPKSSASRCGEGGANPIANADAASSATGD